MDKSLRILFLNFLKKHIYNFVSKNTIMLKFLFRSYDFYKENLKIIFLINIVCILSLFFLMFSNTYIIGGSGFIENIKYDLYSYFFAIILSFISLALFSIYLCFLVSYVKLKEIGNPDVLKYLILNLKRFFISVFSFFIILLITNIIISYFLPFNNLILTILNLILIFSPIIIVLENTDLFDASYKSIIFIKKEPLKFLLLVFIISLAIFLNIFIEVSFERLIGKFAFIISILIISNVIFPFLILMLIELYLESYKISGLGKVF